MQFLFVLGIAILVQITKADYFWRDYHGLIPDDAVEGGTDYIGLPTYIGQSYFPAINVTFPTTIYEDDPFAYSDWNEVIKTDKYTKILCSNDPDTLIWVPTTTQTMKHLQKCNTLLGGYNSGALIWIGRANYQGRTYLSKIYNSDEYNWHGLWIWTDSDFGLYLHEFEMLTYGCDEDDLINDEVEDNELEGASDEDNSNDDNFNDDSDDDKSNDGTLNDDLNNGNDNGDNDNSFEDNHFDGNQMERGKVRTSDK